MQFYTNIYQSGLILTVLNIPPERTSLKLSQQLVFRVIPYYSTSLISQKLHRKLHVPFWISCDNILKNTQKTKTVPYSQKSNMSLLYTCKAKNSRYIDTESNLNKKNT